MSKAREGGFPGGRRPLGYTKAEKYNGKKKPDIAIEPEKIEIIKLIFSLKRRRWSLSKIARHLNAQNVPTAEGGKWHQSTVSYIVRNPIYKGKISYNGLSTSRKELKA